MTNSVTAPAPAHLALLAGLFLIWHGILAADYVIERFALAVDVPSLDAIFFTTPVWARVGWAMGVWLGLVAAVFALMRDDAAVLLFFTAFLGVLAAVIGAEIAGLPMEILGINRYAVYAVLLLVPLIGWLYTRGMKRAGVLH